MGLKHYAQNKFNFWMKKLKKLNKKTRTKTKNKPKKPSQTQTTVW